MRLRKLEAISAAAVLAAATGPVLAADAGLGAAFTNGGFDTGTTVMVPIKTDGGWLIEPQIADFSTKLGGATAKSHQPGVGVYLRKDIGPGYELYYGGIIGYNLTKTNSGTAPEIKSTTLILQPTFGAAHYLSKQFSIAVDAGIKYETGTAKQSGAADQDIRNFGTVVRILARAYF